MLAPDQGVCDPNTMLVAEGRLPQQAVSLGRMKRGEESRFQAGQVAGTWERPRKVAASHRTERPQGGTGSVAG